MLHQTVNADYNSLVHLIADDLAHQDLSPALFLHNSLSSRGAGRTRSHEIPLTLDRFHTGEIASNDTYPAYILDLPGGQLEAQIKQLFLELFRFLVQFVD
jgi:hypothetical protein